MRRPAARPRSPHFRRPPIGGSINLSGRPAVHIQAWWRLSSQGAATAAPRCAGLKGAAAAGMPSPRAGRPAARDGPPGLCAVVMQLGETERRRHCMRAGSPPTRSRRTAPYARRWAAGGKRMSRRPYGLPAGCSTTTPAGHLGGDAARRADPAPAGQAEEARQRDVLCASRFTGDAAPEAAAAAAPA